MVFLWIMVVDSGYVFVAPDAGNSHSIEVNGILEKNKQQGRSREWASNEREREREKEIA